MSLYAVYTVILCITAYTETSKGQEDPGEMEILLGSQLFRLLRGPLPPTHLACETRLSFRVYQKDGKTPTEAWTSIYPIQPSPGGKWVNLKKKKKQYYSGAQTSTVAFPTISTKMRNGTQQRISTSYETNKRVSMWYSQERWWGAHSPRFA